MEWIDTHCHLARFHREGVLDAVLERAAAAGVAQMICIGTSIEDWGLYAKLARQHPGRLFWSAGLHPCYVEDGYNDQLAALGSFFIGEHTPVAVGEIGLDHFHLPKDPAAAATLKAQQEVAFKNQLDLAYQLDLPVVVHSRNAFARTVEIIDASPINWSKIVFHCFSEGAEEVRAINERGGRASFTGIITFKKGDNVRAALHAQGAEQLMLETDAPYLAPEPHRAATCEPAMVALTGERAAQELRQSAEVLAAVTTANARAFFNLPAPQGSH